MVLNPEIVIAESPSICRLPFQLFTIRKTVLLPGILFGSTFNSIKTGFFYFIKYNTASTDILAIPRCCSELRTQ
jgi:hypothetical protein